MLSPKQILAARDKKTVEVHVPEWSSDGDDVVLVGTMGALDYAELQDYIDGMGTPVEKEIPDDEVLSCDSPEPGPKDEDKPPKQTYSNSETFELMVRWCLYSILDPKTRKAAFTIKQVRELGAKNFQALERVYQAALDLNRATKDSAEAFEKNSKRTDAKDSGGE